MKRGTDTRIRREVVGQMLDYAANSVVHWPVEDLRARFELRCEAETLDAGVILEALTGPEVEADTFWTQVKTNLQAGRIRMLLPSASNCFRRWSAYPRPFRQRL